MTEPAGHYMLLPIGGHYSGSKRIAFAKLAPEDYEWAKGYRWSLQPSRRTTYAARAVRRPGEPQKNVVMHRQILGLTEGDGLQGDHRNGNGLDNRRENLRVATNAQNSQNRRGAWRSSSSGIRGVSWKKSSGKWVAHVRLAGKYHHLGCFDDPEEAGAVASAFRREHLVFSEADR